jgi:uridine kinase
MRQGRSGARIIGVDGPAGGGKSTFAARLAETTGAPVIEVDDFISWDNLAGWWPRFEAQVLEPLLDGRDAHYQARDWINDWRGSRLGEWKRVPWAPLVIIEGVTCTRRATVGRLAYAVWVEASRETRLARGLARDADNGEPDFADLWTKWMVQEDAFFAADGTRERADLVVSTEP